MSNPLPSPDVLSEVHEAPCPACGTMLQSLPPIRLGYSSDAMHAHAAAEVDRLTAERDQLRDYLRSAQTRANSYADERDALKEALQFVERWANHHGAKPHTTPQEALSVIQHYPPIVAITKSYADGKSPDTPDPWAEAARLREELERWKETWLGWNAKRAALEADAERWRWLAPRMYSADFDYAENGIVALVFEMPQDTQFYADCNMTIDAARKP